jgi:CubicO group peptidase (beta-lactamase class C family)
MFPAAARGAEAPAPGQVPAAVFDGQKTAWHGFDRYDFFMDEDTLAIKTAGGDAKGQRRCIVVCPKTAAPGNPWSWRGCYWDHQPQTEIELLRRGFHIAYITADASLKPDKKWDAWYEFLTDKHGLSRKPAFIGMSRGGEYAYSWATAHPDRVSCIYADNPGGNREMLSRLGDLARNNVPLLQVCGSIDPILGKFGLTIETLYQQFGGRITMMIKEGAGHHPHSLRNPKPIADFIEQSCQPSAGTPPDLVGARFAKTCFYSSENSYRDFPDEGTRVTCRGPAFTECYDRYAFELGGVEGTIDVIIPRTAAPGKPWVFRAGFAARDAVVDLALLAKGFHIVTGPVPYNADGPLHAHWDAVYKQLIGHGFSSKPVMEGAGGAAGEVYAWAIENPDKVCCVYAENPVLRSKMSKTPPLDQLAPLARAGVPLLHVCGSLDPWLESQTRVAEKRYKELGGQLTVIVKEGEGHYPLAPRDLEPVLDFITKAQGASLMAKTVAGTIASSSGAKLAAEEPAASSSAPKLPGVSAAMQAAVEAGEVSGVVTVVATKDKVLHCEATGLADLATKEPMQPDSLFWIASMTKPITAVALLMLQDEGRLDVAAPVAKYIPEFAALKTPSGQPANLTIAQLMTHTSGLGEAYGAEAAKARTLADLIPLFLAAPMQYEPGARWKYTQSGINTAARIVEIVSSLPFDVFVQRRILDPLGMDHTTFYPARKPSARLVIACKKNRTTGALEAAPPLAGFGVEGRPPLGNGGLFSTGPDYARFCQMLLAGGTFGGKRYLSPAAMTLLTTVQTGSLPTGFFQVPALADYGANYGWGIGTCILRAPHPGVAGMLSAGTFGHGGAWGTQAWIDPVRGVAYVLMIQRPDLGNSDASDLRRAFQQAAVDALWRRTP